MKDEIKYEVQVFFDCSDTWEPMDEFRLKKEAKDTMRDFIITDMEHGLTFKYRIVKITIKREVVK